MYRNLKIEVETVSYLKESARWTKYFSLIQFVAIGFIGITGFSIIVAGIFFTGASNMPKGMDVMGTLYILMGIFYIIYGGVLLMPALNLNRYSDKVEKSLNLGDQSLFEQSIEHLTKFFKITVIMILAIIPLSVIFVIFFSVMMVNAGLAGK